MSEETLPKLEEHILRLWKDRGIFEKSLAIRKRAKPFRFFEGPPTANAAPGIHHVLTRVYKDIICRYKTMRGRSAKIFLIPHASGDREDTERGERF
jgi:isoleucyl-tRNA synthetase